MIARAHSHLFVARLHDTDAAGVLFFAHLFRHAHDAYETFMSSLGFDLAELIGDHRLHLPLVHAQADYRLPIRHGQSVEIRLQVIELGERSFRIGYRFADSDGLTLATAETVHATRRVSDSKAIRLPQALYSALAPYCAAPSG